MTAYTGHWSISEILQVQHIENRLGRYTSVAEPKLFCGTGAGTGAVVNNIGSGFTAPEPKLSS